jgi:TolB-like protein
MGADEAGTAQTLCDHRAAADPLIAQHGGRIVKTTGDGVLIEFGSVVGAVECARALQKLTAERNAGIASERRMEWRIGIHLGDVLVEDEDILGDGVNIAARLEGIAEPGGIFISEDAFRQVRGKIEAEFADLGEQSLKNIARPLRVYRIGPASAPAQPTTSAAALPLPDKPSIAVLPFANLSGDPEQEYFVDGMVEEIITALSRIRWLFVIARNSSFTYKGQTVDVKQVGRELGVRYALEGSARKAGGRVRITAQLIDALSGTHLWADRFDGPLDDVFDLQDKVATSVAGVIEPSLQAAETARSGRPTSPIPGMGGFRSTWGSMSKASVCHCCRSRTLARKWRHSGNTRHRRSGPRAARCGRLVALPAERVGKLLAIIAEMADAGMLTAAACTPASGWEKGQVENQVGVVRERFFTPRLRVASYEELNGLGCSSDASPTPKRTSIPN